MHYLRAWACRGWLCAGALVGLWNHAATAAAPPQSIEISLLVGGRAFERQENIDTSAFHADFRYGYNITDRFAIEAGVDTTFTRNLRAGSPVQLVEPSLTVLRHLGQGVIVPYFALGSAATVYKNNVVPSEGRLSFVTGAGIKWDMTALLSMRFDVRVVAAVGPLSSTTATNVVNAQAALGIDFKLPGHDEPPPEAPPQPSTLPSENENAARPAPRADDLCFYQAGPQIPRRH